MRSLLTALALSLFSLTASAEQVNYTLDMSHSLIGFKVPHLVVSNVTGRFKEVEKAEIKLDEQDLTKSKVSLEIKSASVSTDDAKRDDHLKKPDFLDAEKYKVIKFVSTEITKAPNGYKVKGDLTIRNTTLPVTLDAQVSAPVKSPWHQLVRSVKLSGTIKRSAYGLRYNQTLETGGLLIGDDVTLVIEAEVNKPAAAPPPAAPPSKPPASKPPATTPPAAPQPKPPAATPPKPPAAPTPPAAPKAPAQPKPKQ
jgi:polyisoprenoid-binding protein YceI